MVLKQFFGIDNNVWKWLLGNSVATILDLVHYIYRSHKALIVHYIYRN